MKDVVPAGVVVHAWREAMHHAYALARGERLGELARRRPRLLDDRGLHPYSLEIGRIQALQELLPKLREIDFNHLDLRHDAHDDATRQFEMDTAIRVGLERGWITTEMAKAIRYEPQRGGTKWTKDLEPEEGISLP